MISMWWTIMTMPNKVPLLSSQAAVITSKRREILKALAPRVMVPMSYRALHVRARISSKCTK